MLLKRKVKVTAVLQTRL